MDFEGFVLLRRTVVWCLVGFSRALLALPFFSFGRVELSTLAVKAHMVSCCLAGLLAPKLHFLIAKCCPFPPGSRHSLTFFHRGSGTSSEGPRGLVEMSPCHPQTKTKAQSYHVGRGIAFFLLSHSQCVFH